MKRSLLAKLVAGVMACQLAVVVAACGTAVSQQGCTPTQVKVAEQAFLTVAQTTCIFESDITDAQALATFCKIEPQLVPAVLPLVEQLIAQREGAKKAGVKFRAPGKDGG